MTLHPRLRQAERGTFTPNAVVAVVLARRADRPVIIAP
jgi:hypothetical protein